MSTEHSLAVETATTLSIEELLDCSFGSAALGIEEIQIPKSTGCDIEILRAYTNWRPTMPYFGKIIAVLKYKGRIFQVYFHVWKEHQTAILANQITEIEELVPKSVLGHSYLDKIPTDFGKKAAWLHTPDSELDEESLALRSVTKVLKAYSVNHQLCKKFRQAYVTVCKGNLQKE